MFLEFINVLKQDDGHRIDDSYSLENCRSPFVWLLGGAWEKKWI